MKNILNSALQLESAIFDKLISLKHSYPESDIHWVLLKASQEKFIELLKQAQLQSNSFPEYPDFDHENIVFSNEKWQHVCAKIDKYQPTQMLELMSIQQLHEKMSDFYKQATVNVPHPLSKIFLQSLTELKRMQVMKTNLLTGTYVNKLWEQLGYAPFGSNV